MIVTTVFCGQCAAEGKRPGKLGHVVKRHDAHGALYWWGNRASRRSQTDATPGISALVGALLADPRRPSWSPPESIPVHCRRHGQGRVPVRELTTARGRLSATFSARR